MALFESLTKAKAMKDKGAALFDRCKAMLQRGMGDDHTKLIGPTGLTLVDWNMTKTGKRMFRPNYNYYEGDNQ